MVSGGRNFGKALIHEKRAVGNGLGVLIKEIQNITSPLSPSKDRQRKEEKEEEQGGGGGGGRERGGGGLK